MKRRRNKGVSFKKYIYKFLQFHIRLSSALFSFCLLSFSGRDGGIIDTLDLQKLLLLEAFFVFSGMKGKWNNRFKYVSSLQQPTYILIDQSIDSFQVAIVTFWFSFRPGLSELHQFWSHPGSREFNGFSFPSEVWKVDSALPVSAASSAPDF